MKRNNVVILSDVIKNCVPNKDMTPNETLNENRNLSVVKMIAGADASADQNVIAFAGAIRKDNSRKEMI